MSKNKRGNKMTCKCSTFKITKCEHCGFPRYGYNKYDYYHLATDYYISSNLKRRRNIKAYRIRTAHLRI